MSRHFVVCLFYAAVVRYRRPPYSFSAPGRRQLVEYQRFCEATGAALTQGGLERAPLLTPLPHAAPPPPAPPAHLDFEERAIVAKALDKLAKFPDRTSSLLDIFKVYTIYVENMKHGLHSVEHLLPTNVL